MVDPSQSVVGRHRPQDQSPAREESEMAKKSKKQSKRVRNLLSGMLLFVPALLAAATAFVNAMQINAKGGVSSLADIGIGSSGSSDSAKAKRAKRSK
jgi:hypothetical protein